MDFIIKTLYDMGDDREEYYDISVSTDKDISSLFVFSHMDYDEDEDEEFEVEKVLSVDILDDSEYEYILQFIIENLIEFIYEYTNYIETTTKYYDDKSLIYGDIYIDGIVVSFDYKDKSYDLEFIFSNYISDETEDYYRDSGIWYEGGGKFTSNSKFVRDLLQQKGLGE